MKDTTKPIEADEFIQRIASAEHMGEEYRELVNAFCSEMYRAIEKGRICTIERMTKLYPIFREINLEQDEIRAYWEQFEEKENYLWLVK